MDFVVVGLGVGAFVVLLGLTIRGAGPRRGALRADPPVSPAEVGRRLAIGRACRAGGLVACIAGTGILLVTVTALLLSLSDRAGAVVVMVAVSAAVLGGVGWAILYAQRYHPRPRSGAAWRWQGGTAAGHDAVPAALGETIDAGVARVGMAPLVEPGDPITSELLREADARAAARTSSSWPPDPGLPESAPPMTTSDAAAPVVDADVPVPNDTSAERADPDPTGVASDPPDDDPPDRTTAYAVSGTLRRT
ncbi:MAG: hypothetical protein M3354_05585 [Chloroflexota bacterium]|nr:hypothetical protein [Chloroflexota bacterium]